MAIDLLIKASDDNQTSACVPDLDVVGAGHRQIPDQNRCLPARASAQVIWFRRAGLPLSWVARKFGRGTVFAPVFGPVALCWAALSWPRSVSNFRLAECGSAHLGLGS